jgi:hypothetical protein
MTDEVQFRGKSLGFRAANGIQLDTRRQASRTSCHTISDIGIRQVQEKPGYVRPAPATQALRSGIDRGMDMKDKSRTLKRPTPRAIFAATGPRQKAGAACGYWSGRQAFPTTSPQNAASREMGPGPRSPPQGGWPTSGHPRAMRPPRASVRVTIHATDSHWGALERSDRDRPDILPAAGRS